MVLGRNLVKLRDHVLRDMRHETARNKHLAEIIGVSTSTMQRICKGEVGTSIDSVEWLAAALGVRPQDLLDPQFHLNRTEAHRSSEGSPVTDDDAPFQRPTGRRLTG